MAKETKLILTPSGSKSWKLQQIFRQHTSFGTIEVPKGFVTNLASTPRLLWWILPPFGRYTKASVVHDYLYSSHIFPRNTSDRIFHELMIRYRTFKWKAKVMYRAVRLLGKLAWGKD